MTTAPSRTERIAAILRDEILRGQYRVGERLPSERDLAARFRTSRGTVREALKKLEQVGIASIQPGGARVAPIEECTLDVLGPLLDADELPAPELVDQVLEMLGALLRVAARAAVRKAGDEQLEQVARIMNDIEEGDAERQRQALHRLAQSFIELSEHLVLRLIANGLRTQFMTRMLALGAPPRPEPRSLGAVATELRTAWLARDAARLAAVMERLNELLRDTTREALRARHAKSAKEKLSA